MNFITMIITTLATTALAKGAMECNLSETTAAQLCLGALGKPLIFYLPTGTNKQSVLTKDTHIILKVTNNTGVINSQYSDRSAFFTNGTFKLETVTKEDSGDYLLETHRLTDGVLLHKINTHLEMQGAMECKLSEATGAQQCLGALGEPLIFYLPTGTNKQSVLTKDTHIILKVTNNTGVINSKYSDRSAFFTNGTFKLETVTKEDSGDYLLETHRLTDGVLLHKNNINLQIQAPVSEPAVSQMCLSLEQMKVSCCSEGDGVEFVLTLDSNLLIQTRAGSTDKQLTANVPKITIILHGQLTGVLTCNVRNNFSREETFVHLTNCKASISHSLVVAVRVGVVTLLLVALCLAVYRVQKKTRPKTVN
ncbi:cell adhesion molecule CEACAM5-like [Trachinotus anak]|uniref:cell adhesion molecule CEACAM5-like n=1 Tax=Trachinotus anak TaxID=443729 RepID=UPI0039F19248